MKINFTDRLYKDGHFKVRMDFDTPDEIKEQILLEYTSQETQTNEYLEIDQEIKNLMNRKKSLLSEIKHNFEKFAKINYPEYTL